ncbi:MAG: hypothetical protein ACI9X4_000342 [Glaciecola sp.]|jgi:hypothetical protein
MYRALLSIVAGSLLGACRLDPGMALEAVAQRPKFAPTTQTAGHGSLQSETGVVLDPGDSLSLPGIWRVGISSQTEVYLGGDTYRWDEETDRQGTGDLLLGVRHRFVEEQDGRPALAFQAQAKLPTSDASDGFGSGETDFHLALIGDQHLGEALASVFAEGGFLGQISGPGTAFEWTTAGSLQYPLGGRWACYGEAVFDGSHELDRDGGYLGAGLHYRTGSHSLWDIAVAAGFGDSPEDVLLLVGYTRNVGAFYWKR